MFLDAALFTNFLKAKDIQWCGIDFSKARFTKTGFNCTQEELRSYFNEWNMMIIADQKKYDIRLSFRKPIMEYDLALVSKRNKSLKTGNLLCDSISLQHVYNDEQLRKYTSSLNLPQAPPFALMFVVESFDALSKTASIWVVIQETATRAAVLCEKFLKVPGGFGTKSYWGRVFYNLLYDIRNHAFHRWENLVKTTTDH